jgi:hypothetical protein
VAWAKGDAVKTTVAISIGNKTILAILLAPVDQGQHQTDHHQGRLSESRNLETIEKNSLKEKVAKQIRIGAARSRLFQTPKCSIRLYQFEARIPRFMAAPDNFGLRLAARSWMDETDAFVQRQIRSHHCHAAGLAHVHGDGVGAFPPSALLPLYEELNARDDALVASQTLPSFLYGPIKWMGGNVYGHG